MSELPVREMVLYKHGVGFFVREGQVEGEEVALTFRHGDINDVLKSLAIFDQSGGQVLGVHYQTPMDRHARLANSSIRLSDDASLRDLLRDLRGREATLSIETAPGSIETLRGRVVGLDEPKHFPKEYAPVATVSLLEENGAVHVFRLDALRSVTPHDDQSTYDLTYFLDTSMREDERRTVTLRLSEGAHDLSVQYVAPSPTWRVSYRVVAQSDENGESGVALVQGWGLFDNRLDEDLEDVTVTLVAGQPISFIYDLYASRIPHRATVQDESRIAPGPVEYQGQLASLSDVSGEQDNRAIQQAGMAPRQGLLGRIDNDQRRTRSGVTEEAGVAGGARFFRKVDATPETAAASTQPDAEGVEAGEFFQYKVQTPVSVKRGESALVPIIGSEVTYQRELLYNGQKLPRHPVAALRFDNNTGLTLERGPVTIVEDSDYKGEAVVPFTKDGNEVYLPYAVELGVKVTEVQQNHIETTGIDIQDRLLIYEQYVVDSKTYKIENTTSAPLVITIEAPIHAATELHDTPPPDVETATHRRWRVNVPARSQTDFPTIGRMRTSRREKVRNLGYQQLSELLKNKWLDDAIANDLKDMLDELSSISNMKAEQDGLGIEKSELYAKQKQLRENLGALQATGDEATLRNRMLSQLEDSQDRLEAIEARERALTTAIDEAEVRVEAIIKALG